MRGRVGRALQRARIRDSPLGLARNAKEYTAALARLSDRELLEEYERTQRSYVASLSDEALITLARSDDNDDNKDNSEEEQ